MSTVLQKNANLFIVIISGLVLAFVISMFLQDRSGDLQIAFLDVGQGDAVLITAPNGNRLLYDSGPPDGKVLSSLRGELPYFGGGLDVYIASHPDADHIGGFADVLPKNTPHLYLDAHTVNLSPLFAELEQQLKKYGVPRRTVKEGTSIALGGGVVIDVLAPKQDERKEGLSTNDASAVLLVRYGANALLLTGDLESKEEERLVRSYGDTLHSSILKAGHHGSKTATTDMLLHVVKPEYVVISVGANNKYGHPNSAALSRMQAAGAKILQTAQLGTIHFRCTEKTCAPL